MTRTERQQESVRKWIKAKGRGTIEGATGYGKTNCALIAIRALLKKYPQFRILVVVPTEALQNQWLDHIDRNGFQFNVEVVIINTCIKHSWTCDMLVIDEAHRVGADEFSKVFKLVKYKLVLGLTATIERLDGKHTIIQKYCPVVDNIPMIECLINGWISKYKEYQVLIDIDDINEYKIMNKEFIRYFEFFNYDFDKAKKCCGENGWRYKLQLCDEYYQGNDENKRKEVLRAITVNSMGLMRIMQKRKSFIYNHPKKIEIAKKIMEARKDSKIITFSNNVKMAEAIENGQNVYTGKTSKKKGRVMIDDFISGKIRTLNSCQRLNEGFDCPDASVAIMLGFDSSEIKSIQRKGRVVRKFENKIAEIFYIVIKGTQEEKWFKDSHKKDKDYITIDEKGLEQVLKGEQPNIYKPKLGEIMFRF